MINSFNNILVYGNGPYDDDDWWDVEIGITD